MTGRDEPTEASPRPLSPAQADLAKDQTPTPKERREGLKPDDLDATNDK